MSTADQLNGASCPVSGTKMDERVARVIAAQVVVMISLSLVSPFFPVAILLVESFVSFPGRQKPQMLRQSVSPLY
jgi:hypothetical protein